MLSYEKSLLSEIRKHVSIVGSNDQDVCDNLHRCSFKRNFLGFYRFKTSFYEDHRGYPPHYRAVVDTFLILELKKWCAHYYVSFDILHSDEVINATKLLEHYTKNPKDFKSVLAVYQLTGSCANTELPTKNVEECELHL